MEKNVLSTIKELFSTNFSRKKIYFLLSFILFSELIMIGTNKLFPLYNIFLSLCPQGIPQKITTIIELAFYISFFLSTLYTLSFWFLVILYTIINTIINTLLNKFDSLINIDENLFAIENKINQIAHGCELNLSITNDSLLITLIPLIILNDSILLNCITNHPLLSFLIGFMMLFTIPSTLTGIINRFFSLPPLEEG